MEKRTIVLTSQTAAIKARRLLEQNGINALIVSPARIGESGCRYGIEVMFIKIPRVLALLARAQIGYTDIF